MSNPENHHKISYVEFASTDIEQTKKFYSTVFGWSFQDWGPDYISFGGKALKAAVSTRPIRTMPRQSLHRSLFSTPPILPRLKPLSSLPAAASLCLRSSFPAAAASTFLTGPETCWRSGRSSVGCSQIQCFKQRVPQSLS
jgi:hypothetical protein